MQFECIALMTCFGDRCGGGKMLGETLLQHTLRDTTRRPLS